jgi:hypothetical protein
MPTKSKPVHDCFSVFLLLLTPQKTVFRAFKAKRNGWVYNLLERFRFLSCSTKQNKTKKVKVRVWKKPWKFETFSCRVENTKSAHFILTPFSMRPVIVETSSRKISKSRNISKNLEKSRKTSKNLEKSRKYRNLEKSRKISKNLEKSRKSRNLENLENHSPSF